MSPGFADPSEHSYCQTEFLVRCPADADEPDDHEPDDAGRQAEVRAVLRFLQLRSRAVEEPDPRTGDFRPVDSLEVGGELLTSWDEAVERTVPVAVPLARLLEDELDERIRFDGAERVERVGPPTGIAGARARVRRTEYPITARLRARAEWLDASHGVLRMHLRVDNDSPAVPTSREAALRHALIAAHLVVGLDGASALSSQDPPEWARPLAATCRDVRLWPVLAGPEGDGAVVLASPIIIEDHPRLAPESPVELYDATEIDEILTLRTLVLTDDEKREARSTDTRAAALMDHVDALPGDLLTRLHGAVRALHPVGSPAPAGAEADADAVLPRPETPWWDPGADASVSPGTDTLVVGGVTVGRGSRVRMRPGSRRADAQDLFLAGRIAVVEAVLFDVDGEVHLAVTPEDDPAADLNARHGRYLYFAPDEVEPLGVAT